MSFPFGVSFDGFATVRDAVETAKRAEACGARSLWIAEHMGYRESFVTATAMGLATAAARIFPTSVSPYLRHPTPTAMAIASLAEMLPGRYGVAIGVGNPLYLRESGREVDKPVRALRDYVAALRALLRGESVQQEGHTFTLKGARLAFTPSPPPVYLTPMGPQMLRLSGEIGDGLVLSAGLTPEFVARSLAIADEGARAKGRDPAQVRKTAYLYFIGGGPLAEQRLKIRQKLAFLFRNENIRDNIASSGLPIDQEAIMAANARRDAATALSLVPEEAADRFAIVGDAAHCRRCIDAYLAAGLDELILSLAGSAEDRLRSLDLVASL